MIRDILGKILLLIKYKVQFSLFISTFPPLDIIKILMLSAKNCDSTSINKLIVKINTIIKKQIINITQKTCQLQSFNILFALSYATFKYCSNMMIETLQFLTKFCTNHKSYNNHLVILCFVL